MGVGGWARGWGSWGLLGRVGLLGFAVFMSCAALMGCAGQTQQIAELRGEIHGLRRELAMARADNLRLAAHQEASRSPARLSPHDAAERAPKARLERTSDCLKSPREVGVPAPERTPSDPNSPLLTANFPNSTDVPPAGAGSGATPSGDPRAQLRAALRRLRAEPYPSGKPFTREQARAIAELSRPPRELDPTNPWNLEK